MSLSLFSAAVGGWTSFSGMDFKGSAVKSETVQGDLPLTAECENVLLNSGETKFSVSNH